MPRVRVGLAALLVGVLTLSACTIPGSPGASGGLGASASSGTPVLDEAATKAALATLGSKPGKDLKPVRLGAGLLPPTNKWFSGLVFGDTTQPVFPLPLSFGADASGLGFGVPAITTSAKTIMGGYRPSAKVSVPGTASWMVTAYDELSVTLTAQGASARVLIAEGSPFVTLTSEKGVKLATNMAFVQTGGVWTASDGTTTYGVVADKATISTTSIDVQAGGRVTWFAVPKDGKADALAKLAVNPVSATSASYTVGGKATTTLHYATASGQTAFGVLPHQQAGLQGTCDLGTFPTVLGTMKLCAGNDLTWTTDVYAAKTALDLSKITEAEKADLKSTLVADVASAKPYPADTYFGGKALYRDSQLYMIAKQLGDATSAETLKKRVTDALVQWTNPKGCATASAFCFFYDSTNKGIVGQTPSFGSDEFNDHHFHYGYFLYAAGVMAADDPSLVEKVKPVMNLLAADIASSQTTAEFVEHRNFDAYVSHSWASGTSPFADGNNQESSSEAVNAWSGLTLWARASGNKPLEAQATWMQALEGASARAYWTNFDLSDPVYAGFAHKITPLNFSGKRDYGTWFSAEPAAALAILLLPMNPSSDHLKGDAARIAANLAEATGTKGYDQTYGDYLVMYSALQGETQRVAAIAQAKKLAATSIDDGDTRTYLLAWLYSLKT